MTKSKQMTRDWSDRILWLIYGFLLLVLLPHTAWWFSHGEPTEPWRLLGIDTYPGQVVAWLAAIVFELLILAMTHKLALHIRLTPNYQDLKRRARERYLNIYSLGLVVAWIISTMANLSHAVEFARPMKIIQEYSVPVLAYSLAAGAILPTASLIFAWVLSTVAEANSTEGEGAQEIRELKRELRLSQQALEKAELLLRETERKQEGEFTPLLSVDKRVRVLFARQKWPELKQKDLAIVTEASPAYVSEVLRNGDGP